MPSPRLAYDDAPDKYAAKSRSKPPRPGNAVSQSLQGLDAKRAGMRFGKNNKVAPLVMQSVQNAQSLRTSQQLAIGTLKVVSSE